MRLLSLADAETCVQKSTWCLTAEFEVILTAGTEGTGYSDSEGKEFSVGT